MDQLDRLLQDLIYELKDGRNDGYSKEYYRKRLQEIKQKIEKALK